MNEEEKKRRNLRYMKELHGARRKAGVCINNATHGKARKGGRCLACWNKKLKAERVAWAAGKKRR